jgi:hypothetical protein
MKGGVRQPGKPWGKQLGVGGDEAGSQENIGHGIQFRTEAIHAPARKHTPLNELPVSLRAEALAARYDAEDVWDWGEDHVAIFLKEIGLGKYAEEFLEEALDGRCLYVLRFASPL